MIDCVRVEFDGQAPASFRGFDRERTAAILIEHVQLDRVGVEGLGEWPREHARRPDGDEEVLERAVVRAREDPDTVERVHHVVRAQPEQVAAARGDGGMAHSHSARHAAQSDDGSQEVH